MDKTKSVTQDATVAVTDSWVTSKTKIALFSDDRVKGSQAKVETIDVRRYVMAKGDTS